MLNYKQLDLFQHIYTFQRPYIDKGIIFIYKKIDRIYIVSGGHSLYDNTIHKLDISIL